MAKELTVEDLAKLTHKQQVQVAIYAAELVTDLVEAEHRPLADKCIEVAKKWLRGEATAEECIEVGEEAAFSGKPPTPSSIKPAVCATWATGRGGISNHDDSHYVISTINHAIKASLNPEETIDKIYTFYDNLLKVDKYVEEAFLTNKMKET